MICRFASGEYAVADMRLDMQKTMQEHAAVFRTGDVLDEGCKKMDAIYDHLVRHPYVQREYALY